MTRTTRTGLTVTVTDATAKYRELDRAEATIRVQAIEMRCGILVTRQGPRTFMVEPSMEVPFGHTYEAKAGTGGH